MCIKTAKEPGSFRKPWTLRETTSLRSQGIREPEKAPGSPGVTFFSTKKNMDLTLMLTGPIVGRLNCQEGSVCVTTFNSDVELVLAVQSK